MRPTKHGLGVFVILLGLASVSAVATPQSQESKASASLESVLKKMDGKKVLCTTAVRVKISR